VRNRQDGSVEAVFEGDTEKVNLILQWCEKGPPQARVIRVHRVREEYKGEFKDFTVRY
jgi:acylphosphatase